MRIYPLDFESFYRRLRDIGDRNTSASSEADYARHLRQDILLHLRSKQSTLPHPIRRHKTIGQVREETLRRRVVGFLNAVE